MKAVGHPTEGVVVFSRSGFRETSSVLRLFPLVGGLGRPKAVERDTLLPGAT